MPPQLAAATKNICYEKLLPCNRYRRFFRRHIVGWEEDGAIKTDEVFRFPNGTKVQCGHLVWDIAGLFKNVKKGIRRAFAKYPQIESLAIDTWGVDYVLMTKDGALMPCLAYRDSRTNSVIDEVHSIIPFEELYSKTGIQFQPFNTIYQLYEETKRNRLSIAIFREVRAQI